MLGHLIEQFLASCRIIEPADLVGRVQPTHPDPADLLPGVVVVVRDGTLEKWACLECPGGCGEKIQLSLSKANRPHWSVRTDWLGRPTLTPSIRQTNQCRCHFWVEKGRVEWCWDSGQKRTLEGQRTT